MFHKRYAPNAPISTVTKSPLSSESHERRDAVKISPSIAHSWPQTPLTQPPMSRPRSSESGEANAPLEQQLAEVAHQMQQLSLLFGRTRSQRGPKRFLHCEKQGFTTIMCLKNTKRDTICWYCDRKWHIERIFFKKRRVFENKTLNTNAPFPNQNMSVKEVKNTRTTFSDE